MNTRNKQFGLGVLGVTSTVTGAVAIGFLVMLLAALWGGFVVKILWSWFVVPTFGLPALRLIEAIGLSVVVSSIAPRNPQEKPDLGRAINHAFMSPAAGLFIGWIAHFFM